MAMGTTIGILAAIAAAAMPAVSGEAALSAELRGRVQGGRPQGCILTTTVRSSTVVEGTAIIYRTGGSRVWVNRPSSGAQDLTRRAILISRTPGTQLCNVDRLELIDRFSRITLGTVILGDFTPYDRPR